MSEDSLQLISPDTNNLDGSDEVIELDSEDSENDCVICVKDCIDVPSLETQGNGSKPGLDLVEDKPDAKCMTSDNCLVSEDNLVSKCTHNAEGTEGNLSATALTLSIESSSEFDPKDSLALSVNNGEDAPSLTSQEHEPTGLDLVEDKPNETCMTSKSCLVLVEDKSVEECSLSNIDLAVEGSLESRGGSDVPVIEGYDSTETITANNQVSLDKKDRKEISVKECLVSNNDLVVEGSLELKGESDIPGAESHDSTQKMAASNQVSLNKIDGKEISEKKQHSGSDDAKRKSNSNDEKKDESDCGKRDIKSQSCDRKGSVHKRDRSKSRDKKGSVPKRDRSKSRDKKGSVPKRDRSKSRDKKGSVPKRDRSKSRDKKDSIARSGRSQSRDRKGSVAKRDRSKSRDRKGSVAKGGRSKSRDRKGSVAKGGRSKSRDRKGSVAKGGRSKSRDRKGSVAKGGRSKSRDRKGSVAKGGRSKSRDRKGSVVKGDRSKSRDRKGSVAKGGRSKSRDRKGSVAKGGRSKSRDRKGSVAKGSRSRSRDRKSNQSPGKKDRDSVRTKRNRSGSRHCRDENRKRRRVSNSRSRSRSRDHRSRIRGSVDREREKTRQVSNILQSQIDRLKEEVEKARAELERNGNSSRRSRSRSLDQRDRLHRERTFHQRSNRFPKRSRSRSLDRPESTHSISRRSQLPSVQRFLDVSEEKQVVVVKNIDVKDHDVRSKMMTKFKRFGALLDSSLDLVNKAAILHYKRLKSAQEAVKSMNNRYFEGEYLMVVLVNERDAELAILADCAECGKGHSPSECTKLKRRSQTRSSSLGLHWPAQPRHPSTNLFDLTRDLSPLSHLMATESLRDGSSRPVAFRPKPLSTSLTKTSTELSLGPERLARREMMMKKRNGVVNCDWGERSLSDFEVLSTVGKGTYGQMYKAADKDLKLLMALKKVTVENDKGGFPISALEEMKLLSRLDHQNIVKLVEILRVDQENFVGAKKAGTFYFVYDYMNHDLKRLLQSKLLQLKSEDVAWFIKQLLSALSYCHRFGLVHRDVRPSNILINNRCELKLAQFGLACLYDEKAEQPATSSRASTEQRMVSLWYRAPELLLGEKKSSPSSDIWSCGCVIGEIFSRKPVFLGSDEQHQIEVISKVCGTPNASNWPGVSDLPLHYILKGVDEYPRLIHDAFHYVPYSARNLLDQLLVMDPAKRLTAESALDSDWLKDAEFPRMLPMMLVNINDCHMLMPAKSPIDSDVHRQSGVGKASSVSVEDRNMEGYSRSNFVTRARKEDVSDKVAIARSLGSASVHESDTVWKSLQSGVGRETIGVSVTDVQVSNDSAEEPYPMSSQPSRRAFNPRVKDYACQPTYVQPVSIPEKPVLQPEKRYTGSVSVRPVNIDSRTNLPTKTDLRYADLPQRSSGEGVHTDRFSSSLESRPATVPFGAKPAAQASDERTFSADLERLRMLKKKLAMVGTEKRDPRANLAKAGDADNWNLPPTRNLGESSEFGVDRLEPPPKRAAISGQPSMEQTTILRGASEIIAAARGNVGASYRSQRQPAVGPQSWPFESSTFGGDWEGPYSKPRDEGNPLPSHEPRFSAKRSEDGAARVVERPSMAPGRAPVTYADPTVNRLHRSYAATSEYEDSQPHEDSSDFSGGWGDYQQPETKPPYNRKPLPAQVNSGIRGPASAAQAWDEPYPQYTVEQRWVYNQQKTGQSSRYPDRGQSESAPHPDERWSAGDRSNEATRPDPGSFYAEADVEWRAPESRL